MYSEVRAHMFYWYYHNDADGTHKWCWCTVCMLLLQWNCVVFLACQTGIDREIL